MPRTKARHDRIDSLEDVRDDSKAIVETLRDAVLEIAEESDDFETLLAEIALRVENELAAHTTRAALTGFYRGAKVQIANKGRG